MDFLNFLHEDVLPCILKRDKAENLQLFGMGPIKPVLFICSSVHLSDSMDFLYFLQEDILPNMLKSDKAIISCLDNRVNETNLDQKQNI